MSQSNPANWVNNLGVARSLTWRYVIALSLVATLSTAAWVSLHLVISEQKSTAAVVNVSGRQRMLSQRIALFSNLLMNTPKAERPPIRGKLKDAIDLMARSHRGLTHGDKEMGLPDTMSPAVRSMYFDGPNALDVQVETYIKTVQALLLLDDNALTPENTLLQYITKAAPTTLVSTLDQMVRQYQLEGEASVGGLQKAETIFWLVTLLLLMLEALLIFHPFVRHVRTIIGELQRVTDELQLQQGHLEELVRQRTANLESRSKELVESEEKFRLISTAAQDAIMIIGTDEQVIYWNPAAEKIFGYKADEAVGKNLHTLLTPVHYRDAAHNGFEHFRHSGEGNFIGKTFEITALRKNGEEFPIELSISAVRLQNSWHALGIIRDITERKKAEEELRRYKDHLEEEVQQRTADLVLARNAAEAANRAKSVFLSSMSHELRTPLNAILGFSKMMRKAPLLAQDQRENLDIINRSGEHLLTLINDVLEMAKIDAGHMQLENAPFDLGGLVRDVTDMMEIRAKEKGLQLLLDQSSQFPRYILGDEARLRQVLVNLVGNAIKFTQQGGVTIRLGTKENKISHLLIEVEDSGSGITPEDRQRIFQPFVQLSEQGSNKGTGLGLTISRQFVELMGGSISIESTPGKGSLFRVSLPLREAAESDITKPNILAKGDVVGRAPGQPEYRILIVEDQLENQLLLTQLMDSVGFPVKVAENGEQGVQLFQSWRPHLIWMDRRMPVMDGMEATRRIRELPGGREVKIVAVTASAFMEQRDEMLNAGMDEFVRKPYRFNEIYECLTRQLGVQYIYADAQAVQQEESDVVLDAEMLAVLPPELRRELHDALKSLENERISAVIGQVASHDAKLQKTLSHLAENYDYPAILKALQMKQTEK